MSDAHRLEQRSRREVLLIRRWRGRKVVLPVQRFASCGQFFFVFFPRVAAAPIGQEQQQTDEGEDEDDDEDDARKTGSAGPVMARVIVISHPVNKTGQSNRGQREKL